jgi:PKD repeat protein
MAHNGGLSQVVPWFPDSAADFPWINVLKINRGWALWTTTAGRAQPDPSYFNEYGYPNTMEAVGGLKAQISVPSQTARPGNWLIKWTGYAGIGVSGGATVVSGTTPATNGRVVISVPGSAFQLQLGSVNTGIAPLTNMAVIHEDDEELYDGGQIFGVEFLAKMREANFGVVRFLDWQAANTCRMARWADRKPENYFSYVCDEYRADLFAGDTTNVGNAYSLTLPGFVLEQGATALCRINVAATGLATLNINSTGDKSIVGYYGADYAPTADQVNAYCTFTYDEYLDKYIMSPGSMAGGGHTGGRYLSNTCPIEICVALANELNAHPWLHIPYLAVDPMTDFTTEIATYCKNNLNPGLVPRFELINETWNSAAGFYASRLSWEKSEQRWGVPFDGANWQGMCGALMGEAVSAVYLDDRTKYQTIIGLQTFVTGVPDAILASTKWVLDGGDPASDWITHIAVANYWCPRYWEHFSRSTTQELAWAYEYNTATAERQAEILEEYVSTGITENVNQTPARFAALAAAKHTWAQGLGVDGITCYEGGYSPDYSTANMTRAIIGVTQAAQAVCTMSTTGSVNGLAPAGATVTISGIGGMTELNGNTYTVVSSTGTTMTLNVDSTGFTPFSSNGTATYVNSSTFVNALRRASKFTPAVETYELQTYNDFVDLGGEFPSCYMLSGYQLWSVWDPGLYVETPSTRWDAILAFNSVSAPGADFSATPLTGTTPLSVTFTDESTGTPTSWLWERNDGSGWATFSTSQSPTASFTAGTWSVRLTATNANGSNTLSQTDYIVVIAEPFQSPRGAGSNRNKKKERRYVLEMDNNMYHVSSLEEARAILQSQPKPTQKKNKTLKLPKLTIELMEVSRVRVKNVPLVKALTMNVPLDWIEDAIQRIEDDEEEALLLLLH